MILSLALALIFVFSLSSMAFAANGDMKYHDEPGTFDPAVGPQSGYALTVTEDDPASIRAAVTKELDSGLDTALPLNAYFVFEFEPKTPTANLKANPGNIPLAPGRFPKAGPDVIAPIGIRINSGASASQIPALDASNTNAYNQPYAHSGVLADRVKAYDTAALVGEAFDTDKEGKPVFPALKRYQMESVDFLKDITASQTTLNNAFPDGAGVYVYKVTETGFYFQPTSDPKFVNGEHMVKSTMEYEMYVYVEHVKDAQGQPTTDLHIRALGVVVVVKDGTAGGGYWGPKVKDKVDPTWHETPGTDGKLSPEKSAMLFFNDWSRKSNPDDPNVHLLEVEKKIPNSTTWTLATDGRFDFNVSLSRPATAPAAQFPNVKYAIYDDGTSTGATAGYVTLDTTTYGLELGHSIADETYGTAPNTQTISVATAAYNNGTVNITVKLAPGEKIVFLNVPAGTAFTSTETLRNPEQTDLKWWISGTEVVLGGADATLPAYANTGESGQDRIISDVAGTGNNANVMNKVTTTNSKNDGPPTGILMNNLPFFVLIAISAAAILAYVVVRGTKREGVEQ